MRRRDIVQREGSLNRSRVAVIGADGFVGRRVCAALAASDWATPVAIVRRPSTSSALAGVERVQCDATDAVALRTALLSTDGAVNCVLGDAATIVANGRALIDTVQSAPSLRVVYLSSMAVYGTATGDVDETAPLRDDLGPYSTAKVAVERMAAGLPDVAILRPGIIYGPDGRQWSGQIADWLEHGRIGDLGPAGDGHCNLVHVDDVARAALLALRDPSAGGQAYNLAMHEPPTWNEYFSRFAIALGIPPVRRIPDSRLTFETRLLAPALKIARKVTTRVGIRPHALPEPISSSLLVLWRQKIRLTTRKVEQELGLRSIPLEAGLRETADHYRGRVAA